MCQDKAEKRLNKNMKVVITGGGSGGHIYPALAIADKIREKKPDAQIVYVGSKIGLESKIVPKNGYEFKAVPARWVDYHNSFLARMKEKFKAGCLTTAGVVKTFGMMRKLKPDVVIGTGGYVCAPVIIGAKLAGATAYIHEQNAFAGKTNRLLEPWVSKVFLGMKEASANFKDKKKVHVVGNPVRASFFDYSGEKGPELKEAAREKFFNGPVSSEETIILTFGGSQGSMIINNIAMEMVENLHKHQNVRIIFVTGAEFYQQISSLVKANWQWEEDEEGRLRILDNRVVVLPYIDEMDTAIGASDLVIGRAGALTIGEITAAGRGSVLIPMAMAKDNHQYYNALVLANAGGAMLVEEKDIENVRTAEEILTLATDKEKVEAMGRKAASISNSEATEHICQLMFR